MPLAGVVAEFCMFLSGTVIVRTWSFTTPPADMLILLPVPSFCS